MGGLTAAWQLSGQGHQVTVYQRGWRLGGKGASGRNRAQSNRIEEHGLHILMGFYDHAFNLLSNVYREAHALPAYPDGQPLQWDNAFTPCDDCVFARQLDSGEWDFLSVPFPPNLLRPWDNPRIPDFRELVRAGARQLEGFFDALEAAGHHVPEVGPLLKRILDLLGGLLLMAGETVHEEIAKLIEKVLEAAWQVVRRLDPNAKALWTWIGICFAGGNLIGMLRSGLVAPDPDFTPLNSSDYADWLKVHLQFLADKGCPETLLWRSPLVTALYDLAFSRSTTLGAGVTLYVILRLALDYRGHVAYKMNSGMGDVVFAPLYLALARRGVQFRFFHRVVKLHLDAGRTRVQSIDLEHQVDTPTGYAPLIDVAGRACWPNEPRTELLSPAYQAAYQTGNRFNFETTAASPYLVPVAPLQAGTDFDVVVLAISHGGLAGVCDELSQANAAFQAMVTGMKTIRTQALQVWLRTSLRKLDSPPGLVIAYRQPFNSWADMSQVLPTEGWAGSQVITLAYFCDELADNVVGDPGAPAQVVQNATEFLDHGGVAGLWPKFTATTDEHQRFTRVNTDGSDRYVLSEKGAIQLRLAPDASGFANLALAGDWVRTEINAGCLEAATMGGLGAADAIASGRVHP